MMSIATQMPPTGPHNVGSIVQLIVQSPLPGPPGDVGSLERLSLDLRQENPFPHSASDVQAAPRFVADPPPEPPEPPAPPVPDVVLEVEVPLPPMPEVVDDTVEPPPAPDALEPATPPSAGGPPLLLLPQPSP
jgi:hypothetical protein